MRCLEIPEGILQCSAKEARHPHAIVVKIKKIGTDRQAGAEFMPLLRPCFLFFFSSFFSSTSLPKKRDKPTDQTKALSLNVSGSGVPLGR